MNETLKSVVGLLEGEAVEAQLAAAQVLGALKSSEPEVIRALAACLDTGEPLLLRYALQALADIGTKPALSELVSGLRHGGAIADHVSHLLSQMGPSSASILSGVFDDGDAEMRIRIIDILSGREEIGAAKVLTGAIVDDDASVSRRAAEALIEHADRFDEETSETVAEELRKLLSPKGLSKLPEAGVAQAILVVGALVGQKSRPLLLKFSTSKHPPLLRQAAFRSLQGIPLTPAQTNTVLSDLDDEDMTHVVRPAMEVLADVEKWDSGAIARLKKILSDGGEELRLFALRALRGCHTVEVAKAGIHYLLKGKPAFKEAAAEALSENPSALEGLLKAFQIERNPERARNLAIPLRQLGSGFEPEHFKAMADKCGRLLAAGEPLGEVFLELLLAVDPEVGGAEIVDKALRMRRARKLPECMAILMRLAQTSHLGHEGGYQLGVARLMTEAEEVSDNTQEVGDATMGLFTPLVREGFPLATRLKKERQLSPESLLRVGRHFASGVALEGQFGAELLQHVAEKHGKHQAGEEARLMLRSADL
ncbi:MAG: hypothetical protein QF412_05510 [Planctomycetota bacterium]|jgi:hypothetical protein|nr:hypothetical protein [Planctomycetota bacterium]